MGGGGGGRTDKPARGAAPRLADGSRVNAIIPPLALDGPALSIRRVPLERLDAHDIPRRHAPTHPMLDFLQAAIACPLNPVASGGPRPGKPAKLNIPPSFITAARRP